VRVSIQDQRHHTPVANQLGFLWLNTCQMSDERKMRYLRTCPADLKHDNKRNIVTELCPRSGSRATETADEYERKAERHHQETYAQQLAACVPSWVYFHRLSPAQPKPPNNWPNVAQRTGNSGLPHHTYNCRATKWMSKTVNLLKVNKIIGLRRKTEAYTNRKLLRSTVSTQNP